MGPTETVDREAGHSLAGCPMASPSSSPTLELRFPSIGKGRLDSFDELKGLAMLLVILYHAGGVLTWQNFLHGDVGVDLFVMLSGVGLALSSRVEAPGAFLKRRLLRIYPAYWVVLTLFLLLNSHFLQHRHSAFDIVIHYLGIQAWFGDLYGLGINDSFWFVTLIVSLYLVYALFLRRMMDRPDQIILWAGLISAPVAYAYFLTGQSGCFGHIALRIPGFFAGLLFGRLLRDGSLAIPVTPAVAFGLLVLVYVPYTHGIVFYSEFVAVALAAAYLCLWREKAPAALVASTGRILRFFGTYSLEIFLIHQPLIREYNYYLHGRWFRESNPPVFSLIAGIAIGLALTLILSVELHRLIDRMLGPSPTGPASAPGAA
jgi:peptidoglycan/LPS O-acetylase OafA/YrhL